MPRNYSGKFVGKNVVSKIVPKKKSERRQFVNYRNVNFNCTNLSINFLMKTLKFPIIFSIIFPTNFFLVFPYYILNFCHIKKNVRHFLLLLLFFFKLLGNFFGFFPPSPPCETFLDPPLLPIHVNSIK